MISAYDKEVIKVSYLNIRMSLVCLKEGPTDVLIDNYKSFLETKRVCSEIDRDQIEDEDLLRMLDYILDGVDKVIEFCDTENNKLLH